MCMSIFAVTVVLFLPMGGIEGADAVGAEVVGAVYIENEMNSDEGVVRALLEEMVGICEGVDAGETAGDGASPPPAVSLVSMSGALEESQSSFFVTYGKFASDLHVFMSCMLDEVVDRNTIYPVDLCGKSISLLDSQSSFLFEANHVKQHIDEMLDEVERRREAEIRDLCRASLDSAISKIKRRDYPDREPSRVIRFLHNSAQLVRVRSKYSLDDVIARVEKRHAAYLFRSRVLQGEFLPPVLPLQAVFEIRHHLCYMTNIVEQLHDVEGKLIPLPARHNSEKMDLARSLAASAEGESRTLSVSLDRQKQEDLTSSIDNLKKKRQEELENKKRPFGGPDNPVPPSLVSNFDAETQEVVSAKKKAIISTWEKKMVAEKEKLKVKLERKRVESLRELAAKHEAETKALTDRLHYLHSSSPPFSTVSSSKFSPPTAYQDLIMMPNYQDAVSSKTFESYITHTVLEPDQNFLADNILMYLAPKEILSSLAPVSKTCKMYQVYFQDRIDQAVIVQCLYRKAVAIKTRGFLRERLYAARILERYTRGMLGRKRASRAREEIRINETLQRQLGATSSVVKVFMDGSDTTEAQIASTETLVEMTKINRGTEVIFDTNAATLIVDKMLNSVRLNLTLQRTKSGKSDWAAFIKLIGRLELSEATKTLVMEKGGGACILNMMRRGDSSVREEACKAIGNLSKDRDVSRYFILRLKCMGLVVHMLRSCTTGASFHTNHQLAAMIVATQLLSINKDHEVMATFGRSGMVQNLMRILNILMQSHSIASDATKNRNLLLELTSKMTWKLIDLDENYVKIISPSTGDVLNAMLEVRSWPLANRLGCILTACIVSTIQGKRLLQHWKVPGNLNKHMVNHNADVRLAALVAIEAFGEKEIRTVAGLEDEAPYDGREPQDLGDEVAGEILIVKEPEGVALTHKGTSISDTSRYLKPINIVPPPATKFRLESALNPEGQPWMPESINETSRVNNHI